MKIGLIGLSIKPVPPLPDSVCAPNELLSDLAHGLQSSGHEVTIFTGDDATPNLPVVSGGLKSVTAEFDQNSTEAVLFTQKRAELDLILASEAIRAYRDGSIEIINCHDARLMPYLFAAADVPAIFTFHGDLSSHTDPYELYRNRLLLNSKLAMTSMSRANEKFIKEQNIPYVGYAPNGIDTSQFPYGGQERRGILVVARMIRVKKIKESIEAALSMDEEITLIGPSGTSEDDKSYFTELEENYFNNPKVHYLGYKPRAEIVPYYQQAAVLLFLSEKEGMPMAILEAMSTGLPVAGSKIGGIPDLIVEGLSGALIVDGDDLREKIAQAKNCPSQQVRKHVEDNFSNRAMAENYLMAYERYLKGERL